MSSSDETRTLIELMYENFPKCPVCGHDYAYDFSWKATETHAKCRLCGTRWLLRLKEEELVISKMPTQTKLSEDSTTILGLALLSAGIFTIILFLKIPLGIFLISAGIVMTVIGVPLPPRKKIKRIPAVETVELEKPEEMQLCPQCNKKISKTFKICPHCRFNLKTRVCVCSSCGKKISPHFKLCPYCREKLKN